MKEMFIVFLDFILIYIALVFGFQHPEIGGVLVKNFTSLNDPNKIQVYGFAITSIGFLFITYLGRRALFKPQPDSKTGCITGCILPLILLSIVCWELYIVIVKSMFFIGINQYQITANLFHSEVWFDSLIQLWFPPDNKFFLFGIFTNP